MMAIGVVFLVFAFKTIDRLAAAYVIAVTGTFLCDCTLATVVFRRQFHWSRPTTLLVFAAFFLIDATFFVANTMKLLEGGWVPLALGTSLIAVMTTWRRGRKLEVVCLNMRRIGAPLYPATDGPDALSGAVAIEYPLSDAWRQAYHRRR
jgi:KUP system potassium uptake protein